MDFPCISPERRRTLSKVRVEKVQELMKQEVSDIIFNELKDPRIGFVTVTSVACTEDLREAKDLRQRHGG